MAEKGIAGVEAELVKVPRQLKCRGVSNVRFKEYSPGVTIAYAYPVGYEFTILGIRDSDNAELSSVSTITKVTTDNYTYTEIFQLMHDAIQSALIALEAQA